MFAEAAEVRRWVYMVSIPAVIPAGSQTTCCASLLTPNGVLVITISMIANGQKNIVARESSDQEFHRCFRFQAPQAEHDEVLTFQVEVRGQTFLSSEERKVMIRPYSPMTFIQTDKPTYIPGQTVHFRVVTLDTNFVPVNQRYDIVELEDVHQNRIGQWVNTTTNFKILQLSHPLNSEAAMGSYTITVWIGEQKMHHVFQVAKYVLPRFEVKLNLSDQVNIVQEEYKVEVCATYTYGQPVAGKAELELCRTLGTYYGNAPEGPDYSAPCHKESIEMNQTGCVSHVFNMKIFKNAEEKMLSDSFKFRAKVEEEGTGVSQSKEKDVALSYVIGTLSFVDTPLSYAHGSVIQGKIKAVHFNNTPIAGMLVYLFEDNVWPFRHLQNLTTNSQGFASFSLNTTSMPKDTINLRLSDTPQWEYPEYRVPHFIRGEHTISLIQSTDSGGKTSSSLLVQNKEKLLECGKVSIAVQYAIRETVPKGSVDVVYLVLARGVIVQHGHLKVIMQQESRVTEGEVIVKVTVVPEMAPAVQVLVYTVLPSETVIAHSMNFPTEKCFRHKVSVAFSPSKAVPGEKNTLKVSALPGSLCGLSAVDQSVGIMEPGKRLDADKIFDLLPVKESMYIPSQMEDPQACLPVSQRRLLVSSEEENDPYQVFQKLGLKLATNLDIRIPSCLRYRGKEYHNYYGGFLPRPMMRFESMSLAEPADGHVVLLASPGAPAPLPVQTVRTFFPETWIWDLVEVGQSGSADVSLTVPDTITSWDMDTFCLAPGGFGLAPPVTLTVFQPFFLELTLPYSIIRGERFELKATVFSYLSKCIMVSVTPTPSKDYTLTPLEHVQYSSCLCANGRKTFSWTMAPAVLGVLRVSVTAAAVPSNTACNNEVVSVPERGRLDTVTRSLLVKAEGMEKTDTYNWLLCPAGGALREQVKLELPKNVVAGSARASLSVLGDILGRALKNPDGLLEMPHGCGEQNMAILAPNIYILEYLKNTEQLTPVILDKATKFLASGYQNELNYKHADGAYSTFGQGSGNTWLTAFVLRSFGGARSFVYIDPARIEESRKWLGLQQGQYGCFKILGKLFNNRMKGGVTDEVTLTAYVTAALLEINIPVSDPVVVFSLSCLRNSTRDLSDTYTTALLAYTFSLAGDQKNRDPLLQHLERTALQEGGLLHWSQSFLETSISLSVEVSSYVLLAVLRSSTLSTADLGYASRIVRWLVKQQNANGGFSSTQDTVVGLQALALYSTKVFRKNGAATVTVTSPSGGQHLFDVNPSNKLLYQEKVLQDTGGKYSLKVEGRACASVQVALHYNIPTPSKSTMLSILVRSEVNCDSLSSRRRVTLNLQSGYHGEEPATNMIIVDVKMLSGFVPDPESLTRLRTSLLVDRVDTKDDHVLMYLTELHPGHSLNHTVAIIQEHPVQNLKPAVVKIYDYYQPSDHAETEYAFPCQ
uniref:Alpha-2-macroglobulin bait region domain-containing protein n=1 Tax=Esox lucius TaxID=8010 RepID=A0A6Q2Y3X2_ESOLU